MDGDLPRTGARIGKARIRRAQDEVAVGYEGQTAARTHAVYRGDDGLAHFAVKRGEAYARRLLARP
jgi:hypothetical protein